MEAQNRGTVKIDSGAHKPAITLQDSTRASRPPLHRTARFYNCSGQSLGYSDPHQSEQQGCTWTKPWSRVSINHASGNVMDAYVGPYGTETAVSESIVRAGSTLRMASQPIGGGFAESTGVTRGSTSLL